MAAADRGQLVAAVVQWNISFFIRPARDRKILIVGLGSFRLKQNTSMTTQAPSPMIRIFWLTLVALALPLLAGCASAGLSGGAGGLNVAGDEKGGKISGGAEGANMAAAMALVIGHCEKFGKKGFITKMDYDGGTLTFECRQQRAKPAT
jgi:hypothetical protein